jgi:two-component system CheB/CheR fusion protein
VSAGPDAAVEPGLFLVIFEEAPASDQERPEKAAAEDFVEGAGKRATDVNARIAALKQELRAKEEYLQNTNEELETSNEEFKSSNEEMQSVN